MEDRSDSEGVFDLTRQGSSVPFNRCKRFKASIPVLLRARVLALL